MSWPTQVLGPERQSVRLSPRLPHNRLRNNDPKANPMQWRCPHSPTEDTTLCQQNGRLKIYRQGLQLFCPPAFFQLLTFLVLGRLIALELRKFRPLSSAGCVGECLNGLLYENRATLQYSIQACCGLFKHIFLILRIRVYETLAELIYFT